jgi:hypothetical protein
VDLKFRNSEPDRIIADYGVAGILSTAKFPTEWNARFVNLEVGTIIRL